MPKTFWTNRRVFVTGHTGFKGSWLCLVLQSLGAKVYGYALAPVTTPCLHEAAQVDKQIAGSTFGDIRDLALVKGSLNHAKPEVVFHLAAQPLVKESYVDPAGTYSVNVMGTVNVLEAVRSCQSVRAVVNVTTDKVYESKEWVWGYRENDALGGYDPYSSSKACSELVTSAFRNSFFNESDYSKHRVAIAAARSGNVIGGGDWANDRIIPDCVRALTRHETLQIRYPGSIRPWQHVLDALFGYVCLARKLVEGGPAFSGAWNFSPAPEDARTVSWIVETVSRLWGKAVPCESDSSEKPHETGYLTLDSTKARRQLQWSPRWGIEQALEKTVRWFQAFEGGANALDICFQQIHDRGDSE